MSRKPESKKRIRIWVGVSMGVVLVGALVALLMLRNARARQAEGLASGDVVAAFVGDLSASATASGRVRARHEAQLALLQSGTVAEIYVGVGDRVPAGAPLLQLESADLARAVDSARQSLVIQQGNLAQLLAPPAAADLAAARASVASAQTALDDLLAGPTADEVAGAEADVRAANADVAAAAARLNELTAAATPEALQAAELALELAQIEATTAAEQHTTILVTEPNRFLSEDRLADLEYQARLTAVQANAQLAAAQETWRTLQEGDANAIAAARAGVAAAVAQRDLAQAQLDLLLTGASAAQIAAAQASLVQAEANLEQLQRGPTALQIVSAEVAVAQAETALARAENNLARATLTAPFAGTITAVSVGLGEMASGAVISLADDASLEVVLDVDEVDMADLAPGQTATVTLETWPDVEISGQVAAIAPAATSSSGALVTYEVSLALAETALPIRTGMTASADLVTAQREDVLLLPNAAINVDRSTGTYSVNRVTETDEAGQPMTSEVAVTIGLRDRRYTEIADGLSAGDEVMIGNASPVQTFGPGSGGGPPEGGGPFGGQ